MAVNFEEWQNKLKNGPAQNELKRAEDKLCFSYELRNSACFHTINTPFFQSRGIFQNTKETVTGCDSNMFSVRPLFRSKTTNGNKKQNAFGCPVITEQDLKNARHNKSRVVRSSSTGSISTTVSGSISSSNRSNSLGRNKQKEEKSMIYLSTNGLKPNGVFSFFKSNSDFLDYSLATGEAVVLTYQPNAYILDMPKTRQPLNM